MQTGEWEKRAADLWDRQDSHDSEDFPEAMEQSELSQGSAEADFELASAYDSTGYPEKAVPLYEQALAAGLAGEHRRRAVIQLASSLRNLGHPDVTVAMLVDERGRGSDHLSDAVDAVLALALADIGREREALSLALTALAPHLPRYQGSVKNYARQLLEKR